MVRARSVAGKSLPVSSRFRATPCSRKKATVCATSNRRSTLRMAARDEPAKAVSSTTSWVTLHRPPPATRILAPSVRAPSSKSTRRPASARRAQRAAMRPAAPAPHDRDVRSLGQPDLVRR